MYAPDGFVSAQLAAADRSPFQANDPYGGTPEEYTEAAGRYIAYCGRFHVDEANRSLTHDYRCNAISLKQKFFRSRAPLSLRSSNRSFSCPSSRL
jgi:hypothetical protein